MLARRWYGQDLEDKRLYQMLGHIKNGCYVDIGAYEPEFNSVTKVFYDDGWSGINVEPNPRAFLMLDAARPRDLNLQMVVTDRVGPQVLYLTDRRGWSSLRKDVALAARKAGLGTVPIDVESTTLAAIWPDNDVHFLKIDVEGAEDEVIRSGDWSKHRPWVVVAEANFPQSRRTVYHHKDWEPMLLAAGYRFIDDDTLNRWYIAEERLDEIEI